jgi:uncharacterized cupin superfamily protein
MLKVNTRDVAEEPWASPKGKFNGASRCLSGALGRKPRSTDLNERHPFDVEILRVPPGKIPYPFHSHSAQWEFYHVISGTGSVRHQYGTEPIDAGDAFVFKPGEPHQLINDSDQDLVIYVVADNPPLESPSITTTAKNGACVHRNGASSAGTLWSITTGKSSSETLLRLAFDLRVRATFGFP